MVEADEDNADTVVGASRDAGEVVRLYELLHVGNTPVELDGSAVDIIVLFFFNRLLLQDNIF